MAFKDDNHPRTDETGDIDLDLLEATLRMSYAERIEQNYRARIFIAKLAAAGAPAEQLRGPTTHGCLQLPDTENRR